MSTHNYNNTKTLIRQVSKMLDEVPDGKDRAVLRQVLNIVDFQNNKLLDLVEVIEKLQSTQEIINSNVSKQILEFSTTIRIGKILIAILSFLLSPLVIEFLKRAFGY